MSKTTVGQIGLDLTLNGRGFDKQINSITSKSTANMENSFGKTFTKIGKMAAAAFSVAAIGKFAASCLSLGSDLAEVQNVVDVAFPKMNGQVNDFAKNAITQFGLSETVAKRMVGTYGSMAQAFKFTEKEAADMATTLTGLAGDVASFYNIDGDLAYTKLKSVFSGETETLKDLGIVMTQTALDEYALSKGINKATAAMTEQEKVMLRYQFVQDQLKFATGDFARTQDSWANQTRILTLRWESFKASIGKGLIALFSPIIKGINWVLANLQVLADSFGSLMEMLTGYSGDSGGGALADATEDVGAVGTAADDAGDAVGSVGDGASKAAKKIQKAFAKVDTINKLTFGSDDGDSGSSGSGGSSGGSSEGSVADAVDFPKATKQASIFDGMLDGIIREFERLSSIFTKGFTLGFGDSYKEIERLKDYIASIGDSVVEIFTDKKVLSSMRSMVDSFYFLWGTSVGGIASVGTTIATLLVGSVSTFLERNVNRIKGHLITMFDIRTDINGIIAQFNIALAEIVRVFASPTAVSIGSNLIQIIVNSAMGMTQLLAKLGRDILDAILTPITANKDLIKKTLQGMLKPIETVTSAIAKFVDNTFKKIGETYDQYVQPTYIKIRDALTSILGTIMEKYNEYIKPVIDYIAEDFSKILNEYIQPVVNKLIEFAGQLAEFVGTIVEMLTPVVEFLVGMFAPILASVISKAWDILSGFVKFVAEVAEKLISFFTGVMEFLNNVFSGDWEAVWQGIKDFFGDIGQGIKDTAESFINDVSSFITNTIHDIQSTWENVWEGVGDFFGDTWEGITKGVDTAIKKVKDTIKDVLGTIKGIWEDMWGGLKTFVSSTWDKILGIFTKGGKIFDGIVGGIGDVFKSIVNTILGGINKVIAVPFNTINGLLNTIRNIDLPVVGKPFKGLWSQNPLPVPQIPALAQGGFVKANQPQLVMIGDNRHQGEVVAPENKLRELADQAIAGASKGSDSSMLKEIIQLLKQLIILISSLKLECEVDRKGLLISLKEAEKELAMIGG
ncbi:MULTISPECIES: hypothetical protein [unclassified Breznakia]|uniref:hypothetical protein n=1 Tax=unclassified Breznakia TaxID=2623764 RepID=UPI002474D6C0|nr:MULTISPECIES: hypothetical protein [unclassified Breznakia]MDH6367560.1 phage-related protein [Breznakia sp. PH1-1]MDH6404646.1 phage-related protein [Breznakia sp. PF1-11]MDH6412390.1 phage-related protein [Breznakia sp. PFB1-11]MDH6414728.1 phage-related protein [Breznakia sp. PFB1-14]MDH6417027.1 phage-related protein [Breznakia sp. PFB1-4]